MEKLSGWVGSHGSATVALSAVAPPPVPLLPLLLGAGALGVSRRQFLLAFTAARGLRYGLVAWLGATYGRRVLRYWNQYLTEWTLPILISFFTLLVLAIGVGVWQFRRMRQQMAAA
jgi:membrane protein DedA with SNARE-associated domain